MRATVTTRPRVPASTARLAPDVWRALLACAFIIAMCALAGSFATGSRLWTGSRPQTSLEASLSTGSVLIVSPVGNLCRERVIDNDTWRMHDGAAVDCKEALAKLGAMGSNGRWSGSRVDVIREGFRKGP
jgi:hypothetical protein